MRTIWRNCEKHRVGPRFYAVHDQPGQRIQPDPGCVLPTDGGDEQTPGVRVFNARFSEQAKRNLIIQPL